MSERRVWARPDCTLANSQFPTTTRILLYSFICRFTATATVGTRVYALQLADNEGNTLMVVPGGTMAENETGRMYLAPGQNNFYSGLASGVLDSGDAMPIELVMEVGWSLRLVDIAGIDSADAVSEIAAVIEVL
jgi:hypothetical protein